METIITVATILAMYLNAGTANQSQYYYNADMEDGRITTLYVYNKSGESLSQKLSYRYTYDAADRLTTKEVLSWNSVTGEWEQDYCLNYTYGAEGYSIERCRWSRLEKAYMAADQMTVYKYEFNHLLSVNYLKRNADDGRMEVIGNMLLMNPKNDLLLAQF